MLSRFFRKCDFLNCHEQDGGPVHVYSESLLLPLATPDFSMPYNVITFTCTILALYFGSLLNTLRRRIGEEERRLAKPKGTVFCSVEGRVCSSFS